MLSNRHAMFWGLPLGVLFCLNFWVTTVPVVGWLQFVIMPVEVWVIYRLARGCRDGVYGGVMSYGQVLWYVVQLAMYASLISALFRYVYCKVLNPGFLEGQRDSMMVLAEGLPQLEGQMGALEEVFAEVLTPLNMAVQGMWLNLVACVVVGLVVAGVLRRDGSPFDGEDGGGV